ncbi:MAG: polymer-forming cytoskeletal protein [Acidobacteriota bacterium]
MHARCDDRWDGRQELQRIVTVRTIDPEESYRLTQESQSRTDVLYGGLEKTMGAPMWKKDEIQETETATQGQAESTKPVDRKSEPKTATRVEATRTGTKGDRANIGRSITIKGDITGDEDLHIQGTVDGSVNLKEHNVTIDPEGRVKADVHGRTITVQGHVEGDLFGREQVILRPSCRVSGNITAPRVALEDGANFRGTIDMEANSGGTTSAVQRSTAEQSSTLRPSIVQANDSSSAAKADGKKP